MPLRRLAGILLPISLLALLGFTFSCPYYRDYSGYTITVDLTDVPPGRELEGRLRTAFFEAQPGSIILLPFGRHSFVEELILDTPHVALRGKGMFRTVLDFTNQEEGRNGLLVLSDEISLQDFAVENTTGDGIRIEGSDGVNIERVRVEWTNGPATENGAYGLYPVQCRNVLISESIIKGASDAGIYVGQSENIVVRRNLAQFNVAGIEIENSKDADVYHNYAIGNTGGILVFDLPGPPVQGGRRVRVFENQVLDNNEPNFAVPGSIVGQVPAGTGVLVMANDDVEVYDNTIDDHRTISIALVSYLIAIFPDDGSNLREDYDEFVERIHVHDNVITNGGYAPDGQLGIIAQTVFEVVGGVPIPDIMLGGWFDPAKLDPATGELPDDLKICVHDNGDATFGNLNALRPAGPILDPAPYDCSHAPVVEVALDESSAIPDVMPPFTPEEVDALCNPETPVVGVNWDALVVDCPDLSAYQLFQDPHDATDNATAPGLPYALTTPLFSDYASKYRFIYVPPGQQAAYDDFSAMDFPVGSVITKTFTFPADHRDPSLGEEVIETRLLIRREAGWVGLPYIWNEGQTQAVLQIGGGEAPVSWIDLAGVARSTDYRIPHILQCTSCHGTDQGDEPIGPKAGLLNRSYDYATGAANQLDHWTSLGLLSGSPGSASAPLFPAWDDPAHSLDDRARSYLDSNCEHCHNPNGRAGSTNLLLGFEQPMSSLKICGPPTAAGAGAGDLLHIVAPGLPEESILWFRMDNADDSAIRMPPLSKSVVHTEGVDLIHAWITQLGTTLGEGCP
jgi:parallel beta-helix repeat protein